MRSVCACAAAVIVGVFAGIGAGQTGKELVTGSGVKGGLVVHVGCGEAEATVGMRVGEGYLVQGLEGDAAKVEKARAKIAAAGVYGRVSVDHWTGPALPYTENLVNLLVVEEGAKVTAAEMLRVLAPGGVACVREGGRWKRTVKPWPAGMDEWPHVMYDPSNNAVSKDTLAGPPAHIQWVTGPANERSHDQLASLSVAVSSGGRLFYILDEGAVGAAKLPARWSLVARDAFNGVGLWKRPIARWQDQFSNARMVTNDLMRKLVARDGRVYVTLGLGEPVTALDAATGQVVRTYEGTEGTNEILCDGERLYLVLYDPAPGAGAAAARRRTDAPHPLKRQIVVLDTAGGRVLWRKADADTADLMTMTLAVAGDSMYYQNAKTLICLDARTGERRWRVDRPADHTKRPLPALVVWQDVVLSSDWVAPGREKLPEPAQGMEPSVKTKPCLSELIAYSAKDGRMLWSCGYGSLFAQPVDIFVTGGVVWTGDFWSVLNQGFTEARDPRTGRIVKRRPADQAVFGVGCPHHRCYKDRATDRFIVLGRAGVEFFDSATGQVLPNHWIRGTCQYGILPANGLTYIPPHPCACYVEAKLTGFNALAPRRPGEAIQPPAPHNPLQRGPAFNQPTGLSEAAADWPTYRHDASRSGAVDAAAAAPARLKPAWERTLGGKLTAPVAAGGRVFLASTDTHAIYALNASDGQVAWRRTLGGPVDSPPTVHKGLLLAGCRDGWVYCLRASDGELAWRFRAAPGDSRVVAHEQLESVWPVHGSVLVREGVAWFAAGRSSFLDGGIYLYRLDPATGNMLSVTRVDHRDPKTGYQALNAVESVGFEMAGALPDVLSATDGLVYMRHTAFEPSGSLRPEGRPHLFNPAGFLEDSWFHRTYMTIAARMLSGAVQWQVAGQTAHAAELLVFNDKSVYGFGRNLYAIEGSHIGMGGTRYRLFGSDAKLGPVTPPTGEKIPPSPVKYHWTTEVPLIARAMVLAGETLWFAGPSDKADLPDPAATAEGLAGRRGAVLWGVSTADGRRQSEYRLSAPPTFDGLICASGRLYATLMDGKVVCFEAK